MQISIQHFKMDLQFNYNSQVADLKKMIRNSSMENILKVKSIYFQKSFFYIEIQIQSNI